MLDADGFLFKKEHANFLVEVTHLGNEILVGGLCEVFQILRNFLDGVSGAHRVIIMIYNNFFIDDIDLALEIILFSNRDEDWPSVGTEFLAHRVYCVIEICACAIHFVDESNTGHPVFRSLSPYSFRLRLNAGHSTEHGYGTVENSERALDLGRKIDVAGSVDNIHAHFDAVVSLVDTFLGALHPRASSCC